MANTEVNTLKPMSDRFVSLAALAALDPDLGDVSERTHSTREIGAHQMIEHLVSGEWPTQSYSKRVIGEFLGRVLSNAERQGIIVETMADG